MTTVHVLSQRTKPWKRSLLVKGTIPQHVNMLYIHSDNLCINEYNIENYFLGLE